MRGQDCGGENQRACCVFEASFGACRDGLTEVAGCHDIVANCDCSNIPLDSSSHCRRATPCGGVGQRACCGGETINGEPCGSGLIQVPGCEGNCFCGGESNLGSHDSSGTCVTKSPCGGKGERACCLSERFLDPCDDGLIEVPGCSGDCFCKNGLSTGMCTVFEPGGIAEPATNRIDPPESAPTTAAASCPLLGYADLHLHLFADMAHGGAVLAGKPYAPDPDQYGKSGINRALEQDFTTLTQLEDSDGVSIGAPVLCPGYVNEVDPNNGCAEVFFHGDHDAFAGDPVGSDLGTQDRAQSNLGVPIFNGWPRWSSTTHQQTYYKWLERAWQGGLRLITMLAVTNEALCRGSKRVQGTNCLDSMKPIDDQIAEAKRFESFIDEQYGADADDQGWFRIVYTPGEAREVIAAGKLAVVLGIEVAELFNCKFPISQCTNTNGFVSNCNFSAETNGRPPENESVAACTPDYIRDKVQEYYDMGVRHVFPVHNFDNAFGGAATWQDGIEVGNRVVEDHWWSTRNCFHEGYGFGLGFFTQAIISLLKFSDEIDFIPVRFPLAHADCNEFGLFPLGRVLVEELMANGMLIDVDHVSNEAFDDILDMAEARTPPYPVVATHVLSFDLHKQDVRHERHRTRAQLERIKGVGGMIAAMLKDEVQDTGRSGERQTVDYAPAEVRDDCRYSSKTFAQAYAYAVDVMGFPVAVGSDFNGIAGHFGPRFGSEACGGDLAEQKLQYQAGNRLEYPFTLAGFGTFGKQTTGHKTFDYNTDGMAHIGLLPDFVADLATVGMAQSDLNALFRSAEAYIRVWERAAGVTPAPDAPACRPCTDISIGPSPFFSDTTLFFTPSGGTIAGTPTVSWDFGDGGTGSGTFASHRYACPSTGCPATFTVRATVTDQFGSSECSREITVNDGNDSFFGAQIAIDAPEQTLEGTEVLIRFRHSVLWARGDVSCGTTGVLTHLEATNFLGNEHEMVCFFPGGLERDEDISVTAVPILDPPVTRSHRIRILNRPPAVEADPVLLTDFGTELVHGIVLNDVVGDVLTLKINWGDGTSETFLGRAPGPFELRHEYLRPSRLGTPYQVTLELSDDVDTVVRVLEVEVIGSPPDVTVSGAIRTSVGVIGRYEFFGTDPDGGRPQLGSVSCGTSAENTGVAISRNLPPDPIVYVFLCLFTGASPANGITVTMIDDEQQSSFETLDVVVGTPPTGRVAAELSATEVPENSAVRLFGDGFATDGDPITVDSVTCDGVAVTDPIILTFAGEQKFVDFTCVAPEAPATLTASVTFSDFDGAATFTAELAVVENTPTATPTGTPTNTPTATPTTTPLPLGAACTAPGECSSAVCADGVCCDTACDGPFEQCDIPGTLGRCVAIASPAPALTPRGLLVAALVLLSVAAVSLRLRRRLGET